LKKYKFFTQKKTQKEEKIKQEEKEEQWRFKFEWGSIDNGLF
jgi:hypothetical protein